MRYLFNEGYLMLPEGCEDRSQNIIFLKPADGETPVMIITRDELEAGEGPEAYMQRQLKQMARGIKNFKTISSGPVEAGPGGQEGYGFEARYGTDNDPRYQIQTFIVYSGNKTLIFGLTTMRPPSEKLRTQWGEMLSSYRFNELNET